MILKTRTIQFLSIHEGPPYLWKQHDAHLGSALAIDTRLNSPLTEPQFTWLFTLLLAASPVKHFQKVR